MSRTNGALGAARSYARFISGNFALIGFGFLMTFGSSFGQTFFVSVFNPYLRDSFSLTDGQIGSFYAMGTLTAAFALVWIGKLIDTMPIELYASLVCVGLCLACLMMTAAASGPFLIGSFFLIRLFGQGLMLQTSVTTIARNFEADRGKALSISSLGLAVGQAFLPATAFFLIGTLGWRMAYGIAAAIVIAIYLPLALVALRAARKRHTQGRKRSAAPAGSLSSDSPPLPARRQYTRGEMLRDPFFYLLVPAACSAPIVVTALLWNQFYIADTKGWERGLMASAMAIMALMQVGATLVSGFFVDRFTARKIMPFTVLPLCVGLATAIFVGHPIAAAAIMACLGLGAGLSMVAASALWAEIYGTQHLGAIKALMSAITVGSTAAAPFVFGMMIDAGMNLSRILTWTLAFTLVAVLAALVACSAKHTELQSLGKPAG